MTGYESKKAAAQDKLVGSECTFEEARNATLEEVAREFDRMAALGDTAASFAAFVRGMKR